MKRKIGFVAAVILVGAFVVACNQKPVEPASTSVPSPTPAATEEPATSDLPSDSVIVEDTGLIQPVEQVTEEGPTNEGATYESEAEMQKKISEEDEQWIQDMMNKWGVSREEAEQALQDSINKAEQAQDQQNQTIQERQEEEAARMEQEKQQADKEYDEFCMERYGTTGDHWNSMTTEEQLQWIADHPMN